MRLQIAHITTLMFLAIIMVGTGLLALPVAQVGDLPLIDLIFTATSATCVTGLLTIDVAKSFTPFGQSVIMGLMELGAIGIITISAAFAMILGKRVSSTHSLVIHDTFTASSEVNVVRLVKSVVIFLLGFEALGAFFFYLAWAGDTSIEDPFFQSLFHAVSGFCNAGITTFPEGLDGFEKKPYVSVVFILLFIFGGLGFLVITEIYQWAKQLYEPSSKRSKWHWTLQSRIVLIATAGSILVGALLMYLLESHGTFADAPTGERIVSALFHTSSARTAGFATTDIAAFSDATLCLFMLLMLVGGGPISTAGGIKVTTAVILIGMGLSRIRGSSATMIFNRTVPEQDVSRAISIIFTVMSLLPLFFFALLVSEMIFHPAPPGSDQFLPLLFESVSAFGTVGLSLGATPDLSDPGKVIVALLMLMGRLGPLTVAMAISAERSSISFRYAEEGVMVG